MDAPPAASAAGLGALDGATAGGFGVDDCAALSGCAAPVDRVSAVAGAATELLGAAGAGFAGGAPGAMRPA